MYAGEVTGSRAAVIAGAVSEGSPAVLSQATQHQNVIAEVRKRR
jgi:hypothetical protein